MATLLLGNPPRADVLAAAFQSGKRLAASVLFFKWFCLQATQQQCQRGYINWISHTKKKTGLEREISQKGGQVQEPESHMPGGI